MPARADLPPLARTLILDYYDSYTNNLLTLFTKLYSDNEVLRKVVVVKADRYTWSEFQSDILPVIDCVIVSPGPGSPDKPSDIGFALDLLRAHPLPILGVCLGHQAIGAAFGGKIVNTPNITHGHVVPVAPVKPALGLFASPIWQSAVQDAQFDVVVYNSLTVDPDSLPSELEATAWSAPQPGRARTVQGLAHKTYPIWGVQYHPESISSTHGSTLLHAFLDKVHAHHSSPSSFPSLTPALVVSCSYRIAAARKPQSRPSSRPASAWPTPPLSPSQSPPPSDDLLSIPSRSIRMVQRPFDSGCNLSTQDVFEKVVKSRKGKERAIGEVWLDGQTPTRATTTSFTAPPFLFTYALASRSIALHTPDAVHKLQLEEGESFWDWFSDAQTELSVVPKAGTRGKGWRCGWVGWFGYEMKEESLQGYRRSSTAADGPDEVDACWAWANWILERAPSGEWSLRGLIEDRPASRSDAGGRPGSLVEWLESLSISPGLTSAQFDDLAKSIEQSLGAGPLDSRVEPSQGFPKFVPVSNGEEYQSKIDLSRESIRQGDSYELTLTTSFQSTLPEEEDPYAMYLRLRTFNPAYYSTYMSFPSLVTPRGAGIHVLSSSPERFLRIERDDRGRVVEMMPIKGTRARPKPGVCVCEDGRGCGGTNPGSETCQEERVRVDQQIGQELQDDMKERAENLMIVDLIRADLLSCCLPSTVTVPKLIALESYGVHNLVTTVRGRLAENVGSIEAVRRCFPPGSMTGAPKLRSVQLLEGFEDHRRRGIYSGALGYVSVDGQTDLSVVIRTIVVEGKQASIGAGGAITWLSKRANEWEEVKTKVRSVVGNLE